MCGPNGSIFDRIYFGIFPGQSWGAAFVQKYDPNGYEIWTHQFPAETYAICVYSEGTIVAGITSGAFPGQTSAGGWDAFVREYDSAGVEVRTFQFGTSSTDLARAVAADSQGIYVGGYTNGTFPGQSESGNSDAFIAKIRFNAAPVANAGPDQEIEATGQTTSFSLDGAGSNDPDGDTLTYEWQDGEGSIIGLSSTTTLDRPLGTYTFKLTVTDPDNLSSEDTVTIIIQDTTPPTVTPPTDIAVDQSDPYGTPVNLGQATVSDICDPNPTVENDAPALFPVGETVVTWTATDASGNEATAQQKVTVVYGSPANQLFNLSKLIQYSTDAGSIDPELEQSLLAKVNAAMDALAKANPSAAAVAMNDLKALVNQVEAQEDKKITPETAAEIIAWANRIITDLGG